MFKVWFNNDNNVDCHHESKEINLNKTTNMFLSGAGKNLS